MAEEKLSNIAAIRKYFENTTMQELKDLSKEDREVLGELARKELEKKGVK
jgi:hypothetical protein